ncbi:general stress protein [Candidatus Peregrinibacteria bacterium]|nr:general stress protein [Candidatus Peregrinibacteria bacterium]
MADVQVHDGTQTTPKRKRGFAAMSPEQRRRIASMGGRRSHELGTGHEWTSEEAAKAGSIGGRR